MQVKLAIKGVTSPAVRVYSSFPKNLWIRTAHIGFKHCAGSARKRLNFEGWPVARTTDRKALKIPPLFFAEEVMKESKALPSGNEETTVRGKFISIDEAVKKTGLGKDWFYNHMKNGTLPFPWYRLTVGKRLMDSADIEDWLKLCKVPAGSMPGDIKEAV